MNIAVIEDNELVADSLKRLLAVKGYRSSWFSSAEDFIGGQERLAFDAVICDYRLTGMSGIGLLERLRADGCAVPVLIVSGNVSDELHAAMSQFSLIDCLEKPFHPDAIYRSLERMCPRD